MKSCVGSTWCRYGVGDSVGLAVELENRYKGLRAPHKIKFGVSGCTRECAEAQGKDVGIIATEQGWNLYVCGNGGMKPRHAELIASDLTKERADPLIDRLLMFYVRTADRLQRTSTWRDNLEGGLDYLKGVLIKDTPGPRRRTRSPDAARGRHLPVRVEDRGDRPGDAQALPLVRQQRQADEHIVFVAGARPDPAGRAEERTPHCRSPPPPDTN